MSPSVDLYGIYVEFMHNAAWSVEIHAPHCTRSACMCQEDKTQLVVYWKGHDSARRYTKGGVVGVYLMAAVFQATIKSVKRWATVISLPPSRCSSYIQTFSFFLSGLSHRIEIAQTLVFRSPCWTHTRSKLSHSSSALCLCLPPKASHYAHFVACRLYCAAVVESQ